MGRGFHSNLEGKCEGYSVITDTIHLHVCMLSCFSHVRLFMTPWTVAHQAPLSMVFSGQEYWSGLLCPSPGDLPNPGIKPSSLALQADSSPSEPTFYYSVTITYYFSIPPSPFLYVHMDKFLIKYILKHS